MYFIYFAIFFADIRRINYLTYWIISGLPTSPSQSNPIIIFSKKSGFIPQDLNLRPVKLVRSTFSLVISAFNKTNNDTSSVSECLLSFVLLKGSYM